MAIAFVFTSCSDDDGDKKGGDAPVLLPTYIILGNWTYLFEYDENWRLTAVEALIFGDRGNIHHMERSEIYYTQENIVDRLEYIKKDASDPTTEYKESIRFIYENNTVRCVSSEENEKDKIYELDNKGNLIKYVYEELDPEDDPYYEYISTYTYEYDNLRNKLVEKITSISRYNSPDYPTENEYHESNTYTYDKMNGIFKYVNIPKWLADCFLPELPDYLDYCFGNNMIRRENSKVWRPTMWEYEYNEAGYPVSLDCYDYDYEWEYRYTISIEYIEAK